MTRKQYSFNGRLDTGDSDPTKLAQAAEKLRELGSAHFAAHEDGGELVVMLKFSAAVEVSARTRGVDAVYAIEGQGLQGRVLNPGRRSQVAGPRALFSITRFSRASWLADF